jgi:hypothetical protein
MNVNQVCTRCLEFITSYMFRLWKPSAGWIQNHYVETYITAPWMLQVRSHLISNRGFIRCTIQTVFFMYHHLTWDEILSAVLKTLIYTFPIIIFYSSCCWWLITKLCIDLIYIYFTSKPVTYWFINLVEVLWNLSPNFCGEFMNSTLPFNRFLDLQVQQDHHVWDDWHFTAHWYLCAKLHVSNTKLLHLQMFMFLRDPLLCITSGARVTCR